MKNPSGFLNRVFLRRCNFDTELGQLILTHFFSFPKTLTCTLDMSILVTSSPHAALQIFPLSLSRLGDSPDEESLRRSSTAEPRQIKVFELIFCSIFSNLSLTLANNCEAAEAPSVSTGTPLGVQKAACPSSCLSRPYSAQPTSTNYLVYFILSRSYAVCLAFYIDGILTFSSFIWAYFHYCMISV